MKKINKMKKVLPGANVKVPGIDMQRLPGYKVEKTTGPDFNVYYIYKTAAGEKGVVAKMGIYFGGHPDILSKDIEENRISKEAVVIDGENVNWLVWTTDNSTHCREVLLRNFTDCPIKIHIFILGTDQREVDLLKSVAENFSS